MSKTELTLAEVATKFGEAYHKEKTGKTEADKYKKQLYAHFDRQVEADEIVVEIDASDEAEARAKAARMYPACIVEDIRPLDSDETVTSFELIIKENASLKGFTFVNAADGKVYGRVTRSGGTYFDDDLLKQQDPDLWKKVMEIPNRDFLESLMYECGVHHNEVAEKLDKLYDMEYQAPPRVLKDLTKLDAETLAAIEPYIFQEAPKVAIAPVRDAKDEELEGLDGE